MRIAQLLDQTSKNFPGGNDRGFEWSKQGSNELPTYFWVFPTEDFSGSVVEKTSHVVRNRPLKCPACDARSGYANSKEHIQGKVYVVCFFLHASKTQKNIFASTTLTLCRRERQERTSSASLCRSRHPLSRAASTAAAFLFLPLSLCLSPSLSLSAQRWPSISATRRSESSCARISRSSSESALRYRPAPCTVLFAYVRWCWKKEGVSVHSDNLASILYEQLEQIKQAAERGVHIRDSMWWEWALGGDERWDAAMKKTCILAPARAGAREGEGDLARALGQSRALAQARTPTLPLALAPFLALALALALAQSRALRESGRVRERERRVRAWRATDSRAESRELRAEIRELRAES